MKHWRESVFARDNWICQECGERGDYLHAHHIKSFAKNKALRLDISNGVTLCKDCHKLKHKKDVPFKVTPKTKEDSGK